MRCAICASFWLTLPPKGAAFAVPVRPVRAAAVAARGRLVFFIVCLLLSRRGSALRRRCDAGVAQLSRRRGEIVANCRGAPSPAAPSSQQRPKTQQDTGATNNTPQKPGFRRDD